MFVDVGAHVGQTVAEASKLRWGFDVVHALEPMPNEFAQLVADWGDVATCHPFGLLDRDGDVTIYGSNRDLEASVWPSARDVDPSVSTVCRVVSASSFLADVVAPDDQVVVKLNCEGAEVAILDDWCDSGMIHRITNVLIDFDIRKVVGKRGEDRRILARLAAVGFDRYALSERVMRGDTHQDRIAAWLVGVT